MTEVMNAMPPKPAGYHLVSAGNLSCAGTAEQSKPLHGTHAARARDDENRTKFAGKARQRKKWFRMSHRQSSLVLDAYGHTAGKEIDMKPRLDPFKTSPGALKAMLELQNYVNNCELEHSLQELVKTRASQINGCAFCLHMHTRDARAAGETEERLHLLSAWRESPLYNERERAALAWTETLTLVAERGAPDDVYNDLKASFTEEEMVELTLLINAINAWNRLNVGFRVIHPVKAKNAAAAA
jgi:AhpD family alkylhydroperoxidase